MGLYYNHSEVRVFNEVSSLVIIDLETNAAVSAKFVFLFEPHLNIYVLREAETYLLRHYQVSCLPDASSKVEEPDDYS
jgi:hypothetical protein